MTKTECERAAKGRWVKAQYAFSANRNSQGWVNLLAMGMDLAAAGGVELRVDLATIARDGGLIP